MKNYAIFLLIKKEILKRIRSLVLIILQLLSFADYLILTASYVSFSPNS